MKSISLDNITSWSDFKSYVESMPNTKSMGNAFEQLTKLYFQIDPIYRSKYDNVWLLEDVPTKVLEYLDLPRQDLGIDLIAKSGDEYHAIQCKYHSDKTNTVKTSEISTFTSILANKKNLSHGYICSTALSTSRNFNTLEIKNISNVLNDTWSSLDKDFFDKARQKLNKKIPKEKPFTPKPHQRKAIRLAHKHFVEEKNNRGKLIFPCGSGKSLTGFWMMEKLKANSTVVAVPSLSLVKQTLEVYLKQVVAKKMEVKWLCICSDEGIGKGDDVVTYTRDLPVPCTTDPDYIKNWLKENKKENIIIFTTYQSGRLIAEASKSLKFTFDLGIYDEAHKTVGKNENLFSYLLFEENISVKHRIFMTATERFYRGVRDDVLTMDDPDDYGDVFCHMSFKEAIEQDLLTDYKIITIEVKKEEIAAFIKDNNLVKSNAEWGKENEARSLASMIALRKAMKTLPIKNAVSFHSSIERATRNKEVQKHITETYNYKPIDTYHVSGKLPTTKRNDVVQEFAKSNSALITNSRCLTEGVDVPNIDCIVFADPRKSKVDIVQALGRALRKKDGKDFGYVVLPVIYDHTSHEIDNENFQEILNIVRGLAANDERIIEEFKDKSQNSSRVVGPKEEIFRIDPELLNERELVNNLNIKLWEKLSRFNWMPFEKAREFARSLGLKSNSEYLELYRSGNLPKDMPAKPNNVYKDSGFISMPDFLGYKNKYQEWMSFDKAMALVQKFEFKSSYEYKKAWKNGLIPNNIPGNPRNVYKGKGFVSMPHFLGYENLFQDWMPFHEAREYVKKLQFRSVSEFKKAKRKGNLPLNIPTDPRKVYNNSGFISMPDFLGYDSRFKEWIPFDQAREIVRKKGFKSTAEYKNAWRKGLLPNNIPGDPRSTYKNKGWINMGDWLGTYRVADNYRKYLEFNEARKFVHSLKLNNAKEYKAYYRSGKLPDFIPSNPGKVYNNKGWNGIGDWLGNGSNRFLEYVNFSEAKAHAKSLKLSSNKEWRIYSKSGKKPKNIPAAPSKVYKEKGWNGWPDFLGSKGSRPKKIVRPFNKAKLFAKKKGIKTAKDWMNLSRLKQLPEDLPSKPQDRYENWKGWADFLGKED